MMPWARIASWGCLLTVKKSRKIDRRPALPDRVRLERCLEQVCHLDGWQSGGRVSVREPVFLLPGLAGETVGRFPVEQAGSREQGIAAGGMDQAALHEAGSEGPECSKQPHEISLNPL